MKLQSQQQPVISTWAASVAIALLLSCSHMLDGPDDIQAEQDIQNQIASTAKALKDTKSVYVAVNDGN